MTREEPGQMNQSAATLEAERAALVARKTSPHISRQPGAVVMKFVYPSGSRPLDGYTIKRGVGIGGFGEVYFATSDAGKEVALKRIQRNLDVEVRGVKQCINLKHPNLIALYDIKYDEHGEGWIVMEYVSGESLKDVIERHPQGMPTDQREHWFRGIAAGVKYLHDHGIVHRDLKPANIFADEDIVKIGDYGLSKFISCSRRSGQTESVGTFHYMAPEIGKGVYGKEIDIYALGIILFEMLTGSVPFEGESSQEIIMKHLTAEPDCSSLPAPFAGVIHRALQKDPNKRFSTVAEMLAALDAQSPGPSGGAPLVALDAEPLHKVPPVVTAQPELVMVEPDEPETLYIGDEAEEEGMDFGPVIEVIPTGASAKPPIQRPRTTESQSRPESGDDEDREPIARAVRGSWSGLSNWWFHANLSTPLKVVILVVAGIMLLVNLEWIFPLAILLGAAYLVYYGMRSLVLALRGGRSPQSNAPAATSREIRARSRKAWQQQARASLSRKPASERLAELTGSMLMTALVCAVLNLGMLVLSGHDIGGSIHSWNLYTWLTVSSVLASWSVLAFGKLWESSDGDPFLRRFTMLIVGLLVGAATFVTSNLLVVNWAQSYLVSEVLLEEIYPRSMFGTNHAPLLPAFMIYFGGLFLILRWWKQADPLRRSRLSLWPTAACVIWSLLLPMSQPLSLMLAMSISVAVQLSSPWINANERRHIQQQVVQAS